MKLIDTHSHIYADDFKNDIEQIIFKSEELGIDKVLMPNIDSASIPQMHKLARDYPHTCVPMMGLHPTSVKANYKSELLECKNWLDKGEYCAIGETGIDLYWDKSYKKEQQEAFETQINWAIDFDLPIVIHSRESFHEIFQILEKYQNKNLKGVFHSFTGNLEQAKKAIEMGFLLGINGIVTFKNAGLDKTIKNINLKHLVLETDSPYLAPVPHRGKRNESPYLLLIAQKLAEIYEEDIEKVAEITTGNAINLFKL